ncbi:MAG: hypothetical protein LBL84_03675 [Candidatus Nomurabacteria bacterium]|jgi:hypothetical protein|nr:hypothetical protein [Candidatus Nomurabacteria bacterium]
MRKLEFHEVDAKRPTVFFEIMETVEQARAYLGRLLTAEELKLLIEAEAKVAAEKLGGFTPHLRLDFATGAVYSGYFPIWAGLGKAGHKRQTGVSVSVRTADGYNIAIRRSLDNGTFRGCLGVAAGFLKYRDQSTTIEGYVKDCLFDELQHEIGVDPTEIEGYKLLGYVDVGDQDEAIFQVTLRVTKDELLGRLVTNQSTIRLAEKDVFFVTDDQALNLVSDPRIRGASQHLYALVAGIFGCNDLVDVIAELPNDPKEVFEDLTKILDGHGIDYNFE